MLWRATPIAMFLITLKMFWLLEQESIFQVFLPLLHFNDVLAKLS